MSLAIIEAKQVGPSHFELVPLKPRDICFEVRVRQAVPNFIWCSFTSKFHPPAATTIIAKQHHMATELVTLLDLLRGSIIAREWAPLPSENAQSLRATWYEQILHS
jgi:hypothetical protein